MGTDDIADAKEKKMLHSFCFQALRVTSCCKNKDFVEVEISQQL